MNNIKKLLTLILTFALVLGVFSACGNADGEESSTASKAPAEEASTDNNGDGATTSQTEHPVIRIGGLKGPTTMGLVKLIKDNENGVAACNYEFTVEGAADAITPLLLQGKLDMAAIPANLASVLYNKSNGAIQVLGINTLGVLYIVEQGMSIESVEDLKGKTIYATGKGTTPEYSLRYILTKNGLDPDKDVTIVWKTEAAEVVSQLANTPAGIAMLPQPYVTVAQNQIQGLEIVLNLDEEWKAVNDGNSMVTGVTVVRKEFAEEHPDIIYSFIDEYKASTEFIVSNPEEAAPWVEEKIGVKAGIAQKAIPFCNISLITGDDMKSMVSGYLTAIYEQNEQSVGGALPKDDFYYEF